MAARTVVLEEILRFWESRGVPPCAEAQADGVPCTSLGRKCESCAMAIQALEEARAAELSHHRPELGS